MFSADDEIGRDLSRVDWGATSLGPPVAWPQSLRTAVSILLSSRFPMWMAWGPGLTFFCNAAYRRDTLGRKYPWALGRPASEVWAEIWQDIGPRIDTVLSTGEATWDEGLLLFLERAGYPEETYHTFSYSPLRGDDGAVAGMLCVVSEDTERVIGERRMATLRDLGSDPSVVRTEREVLAFASRQLGRNPYDVPFALTYLFSGDGEAVLADVTGIPAGHPAAPEKLPVSDEAAVWPAGALARGETRIVPLLAGPFAGLPSGAWPEPPAEALVVPLLQQGSAPYGFLVAALNRYRRLDENYRGFVELVAGHLAAGIGSARSYQAQQRRAEELAELDRAKTTFFSNISHEFRTPLTLIMGPVEELRATLTSADARTREELDVIRSNGLRLGKLVNTLLDFSRLEAGRMQARYEPIDLAAMTAELASLFRSAIDRAGLAFDVECHPLPEPVYLDRGMWEKVILNLLSNALKFTFDGSIRVAVYAESEHAVVTVADTGVGVPEREMSRLFERFYRIHNTRARSNEGSGIGLALVKELVGLHGGTISADSREGEGTTFTIRLPFGHAHLPDDALVPGGVPAAGTAAEPFISEAVRWLPVTPGNGDGEVTERAEVSVAGCAARVLVADDNADMRGYLIRLLQTAGHEVHAVADGKAALEAIRAQPPDLVVSDVMMPRLDGLELVAALRGDARTASIPVLLLSARADQEASIEGLDAGADDYLVKPFSAPELLARVRANVELARLRTHHARWRAAMVDSLQEAFFVCDDEGTVIEMNAAFSDMLGYGTEGLPYLPDHPWWPDADSDPEARLLVEEAFSALVGRGRGSYTVPLIHRDGQRLWATATFNQVQDPHTGKRLVVGTLRDVTAEHYAIQRESAMAALSLHLSKATSLDQALTGALAELQSLWRAHRALAVVFGAGAPAVTAAGSGAAWEELSDQERGVLMALRAGPSLAAAMSDGGTGIGIRLEHPLGPMVLWLDQGGHRPFTEQDGTLLSVLAGHLTQGLARAHQIDQQRETAIALQRAILGPSDLPAGFAVRYEPAARPLEVGGDWYDIVPLPEGRTGIVVGDCVGRGLKAASVMGQLRSACRALLLQDARPDQVLMALDRFADGITGAMCTTVFCGVLDAGTGKLTYSSAGHPSGILVDTDGTTRFLDGGRSLPLAVRTGRSRPYGEHILPPRSTLLLYTDGLVERRRRPLTDGIEEAAAVLRDGRHSGVEDLATQVMSRLAPPDGYEDDVALLLYRFPAPLRIAFAAEPTQLPPVRQTLRDWLEKCEVPPEVIQDILVACGEACANSVEHGHRDAPGGTIRLTAEVLADHLRLTIADTGRWKMPDDRSTTNRGRGLMLMRALMNHVTVTPTAGGTTVDMHTRITS
ncbi:SpoIIE family protein phosphatase [Amycolatopsis pigmentata]|uniref:histidine kinase n=1 Tax=Amycolatopsis pigmentata TaxID=450801 RepID=A0ABW5FYP6_9PSEU